MLSVKTRRPLATWRKRALDERERNIKLRAALTFIASFGGKTLIAPSFGPDYDKGHQAGAHAAFESAADIARAALVTALSSQ